MDTVSGSKEIVPYDHVALETLAAESGLVAASKSPIEAYLRSCKTPRSRAAMREALNRIEKLPEIASKGGLDRIYWPAFTVVHAIAIRGALLARGNAPSTTNQSICGLRGVLMMADDLELLAPGVLAKCLRHLKALSGKRLMKGRALSAEEIAKLRKFIDEDLHGAFQAYVRGIVAAGLGGGLRREEITNILFADGYTRPFLKVIGKGNKERRAALSDAACDDLETWIRNWRTPMCVNSDRLFVRIRRNGTMSAKPLRPHAVWELVKWLGRKIAIPELSTHDFRRTNATRRLTAGMDLRMVQDALGHSDPKTTARYDQRAEDEQKKAVDKTGVY